MKELPVDDPKQREPEISKARELLAWSPRIAREEGLVRTVKYFKTTLGKK
jgi:dTDP-glucose 4,6-dehydratase